ncbi:MAG: RNA polymerase factor sigma-54 [Chloroflexota bacterium]
MAELELEFQLDAGLDFQQTQRVSARLVAANSILALSSQELQRKIEDELADNPALERVDVATCATCGSELQGSICPVCIQRQKGAEVLVDGEEWFDRDYMSGGVYTTDDDTDPMLRVATEQTLGERLLNELASLIAPADIEIAEALVGSLDERGYLTWSVRDIADEIGVTEERVRSVLDVLQSMEPIGVGARNLRECLLIQLRFLAERGVSVPHAEDVVSDFLPELGLRKFPVIAHALGIKIPQVNHVAEFVKAKLNPNPAHGFSSTNSRDSDTRAMYVIPDVLIHRDEDNFAVEIVESRRHVLRLNPMYRQLSDRLAAGRELSSTDQDHVKHCVQRARLFMTYVGQRRQTLYKVTCAIVEAQRDFLNSGIRSLRPLNRSEIAQTIGVHESTVSRATAAKHVMLPDGSIIPFSHFFKASLSVKDVMKEVIDRSPKRLTDSDIVTELAKRDIHIARRTVSKYRAQLDILSSRLR